MTILRKFLALKEFLSRSLIVSGGIHPFKKLNTSWFPLHQTFGKANKFCSTIGKCSCCCCRAYENPPSSARPGKSPSRHICPGGNFGIGHNISPCTCTCMAFHTIHNNNGLVIVVKLEKSVASRETQAPLSPNAL